MEPERVELTGIKGHGDPVGHLATQNHSGHRFGPTPPVRLGQRQCDGHERGDRVQDGFRMMRLKIDRISQCPVREDGTDDIHLSFAPHQRRRTGSAVGFGKRADT